MRPLNDEDMPISKKIKTLAEIIKELSEQLLKEVAANDGGKPEN